MSQKEILLQNIKKKFEELSNHTKNNITDNNNILKEIKNIEDNIIKLLKDNKIEKSELDILDDEDKKKFVDYYSDKYGEAEGSLKKILEDADNKYQTAIEKLKNQYGNNESED